MAMPVTAAATAIATAAEARTQHRGNHPHLLNGLRRSWLGQTLGQPARHQQAESTHQGDRPTPIGEEAEEDEVEEKDPHGSAENIRQPKLGAAHDRVKKLWDQIHSP